MMSPTPDVEALTGRPIAHRGWHDHGRPENSLPAIAAAVAVGWPVEIDVRLSRDGVAVVHHDTSLSRLCGIRRRVAETDAAALGRLRLAGTTEHLPLLAEVLELVRGRVPLLLDLKTGYRPPIHTAWLTALSRELHSYAGPVYATGHNLAVVRRLAAALPHVPFGYTASLVHLPGGSLLRCLAQPRRTGRNPDAAPHFLAANVGCLRHPWIQGCRERGLPVLGWTVRTPHTLYRVRTWADSLIVEGAAAELLRIETATPTDEWPAAPPLQARSA